MTLAPGPLPFETLSEPLKKVLNPQAPAALRMMAARGLAPMGPQDLAVALYQLSQDSEEPVAAAAVKTAGSLPDKIVGTALGSPELDPRVLDFFARHVLLKPNLVELILLNPSTDDDTFIYLAGHCTERELELLAANEQRILRTPRIIEVLYHNRATRMSTVDRLIELAVRHGIRCEGIAAFDAVAEAIAEQGPPVFNGTDFEIDAQYEKAREAEEALEGQARARVGSDEEKVAQEVHSLLTFNETDAPQAEIIERKRRIEDLPMSAKIRLATIGNASARAILVRDSNKVVALSAVNSPALSDLEAVAIAQNRSLIPEVIMAIARNKSFLKNYQVKVGLAFNPKTPLAIVLKIVGHLHDGDVKVLAKSKNVPQQVALVARRLAETREKKK